jgi:hypothetical protein
VRFRVPCWALYQVFKEVFISDFYDIDLLLKKLQARPVVVDIGANAGCISVRAIEVHDLDKDQRNVSHLARYMESHGYQVVSAPVHSNCHALEAVRKK